MPDLPTVSEAFEANVAPFLASMDDLIAKVDEAAQAVEDLHAQIDLLPDGKEITIRVNTEGGGLGGLAGLTGLGPEFEAMRRDIADISADLMMQTQLLREAAPVWEAMGRDVSDASADLMMMNQTMRESTGQTILLANAGDRTGAGLRAAGDAAVVASRGFRIFGVAAGTLFHWVVAAGAEFLAVAIPATVALGAAMLVAAQGAQMVQQHMSALYTATEATANMFHVTFGQALGLRGALQQAQDAANPIVWSTLGAAVNIVKGNFQDLAGQGLDVMRIFQTFTAHVVADFQAGFGDQIHGLLSGMVADLVMFGQTLGNIGHAVLNFAAAMPGLAEVLLGLVTAASHVLLWFSQLPPVLITVAMAMEELWRWGGPLVAILTKIPVLLTGLIASGFGVIPVFARIGQIFQAVISFLPALATGLGVVMSEMTLLPAAFQEAGASMALFGTESQLAIAELAPWQAALAGVAAIGLGFLAYKFFTARSAAVALGDAMQQTVDKAQGMKVFSDIASNIGTLNQKMAESATQVQGVTRATNAYSAAGDHVTNAQRVGAQTAGEYNSALQQQSRDLVNATQAVGYLSQKYGVNFVGALTLASQAGVQLDQGIGRMSTAAEINLIKVEDLVQGYRAMGQPVGAIGTDMTAVAIQAGLQSSKIQQLTQAWQGYMSLLTGGTNALATFESGLANIGTVAASSAGRLFEYQGKMTASTEKFAASLNSFTGKGAQNWQNFNQVVGTGAESFINWMQTAGAAGAVSGAQMTGAIKGIVQEMIPFASKSQAARAELAGLAAQAGAVVAPTTKALEAFAKGGDSAKQLGQFVQQATAQLSNMAAVAAKLGNVMQSDLVAMFDKARLAASGLPGALNTLSSAIQNTGMRSNTTASAVVNVVGRLTALHQSLPTITALLNSMGFALSQAQVKAIIAAAGLSKTGSSAATAGGQMFAASGQAHALAAAIAAIQSKTVTVTTNFVETGSWAAGNPFQPGGMFSGKPRAAGGPVMAQAAYLVGERGPELFVPNVGGNVLSNNDTRRFLTNPGAGHGGGMAGGMSGGGDMHATIHNHVFLDGQQIWNGVRTETLRWNVRNGNAQSGAMGRAVAPS